jgi:hypothetical protein
LRDKVRIPRVSDGVIFNVLTKLRVLDGERLSYRTLAVEQIGSVYQAIMGFGLEQAKGRSIAIKPAKKHGAPATINLEELLRTTGEKRNAWFKDQTDQKLTGAAADALKQAGTIEELLIALEKKIAADVTPLPVPKGAMIFQPSDERRKSGSHYTPSSLTGPIVEAALEPVLKQLGEKPTPAQILNLKVCDLAMGSAAFLVEACRQLGDALMKAWHAHNEVPQIPLDEDEALFAQRMIAQRCLYGLDKNQMAADLAKLSLWLATLAKDHPFTFLDHSLRHGDALVGLTRKQIAAFHWEPAAQQSFFEEKVRSVIDRVSDYRQRILNARDNTPYAQLAQELGAADDLLNLPRMIGDAAIAAFFSAEKPRQREEKRQRFSRLIEDDLKTKRMIPIGAEVDLAVKELRQGEKPTPPFHWELEFPEVFTTDKSGKVTCGFDVILGNPPFLGGARIWPVLGGGYADWIRHLHSKTEGKAVDLVAHFFRRAFSLLRESGCFGLIATNSISQGDTREAGLKQICKSGGQIYRAVRRVRWPGQAAVVVSVVFVTNVAQTGKLSLDGKPVDGINSFLFPNKFDFDPLQLRANQGASYQGACVLGMGFTFDDTDTSNTASSIAEMRNLIQKDPRNSERIFPYIGGKEVNSDPQQAHHRYVIDFEDMSLEAASHWPHLLEIVKSRVKPARDKIGGYSVAERRKEHWWQFGTATPALNKAKAGLERVLVIARISNAFALAFLPAKMVFNEKTIVFSFDADAAFSTLQSRIHETWARFFGSTLKDDFQYTPSDCFETFPLPADWLTHPELNAIGKSYYEFRSNLMLKNDEGLTTTYNRFHDPDDFNTDIMKLRDFHSAMDRVVLDSYSWTDIPTSCEFVLDYEVEDDESGDRKKPYRYRWPDEVRDEVLARLLELNRQRALEEGQMVVEEKAPKKKRVKAQAAETPLFE